MAEGDARDRPEGTPPLRRPATAHRPRPGTGSPRSPPTPRRPGRAASSPTSSYAIAAGPAPKTASAPRRTPGWAISPCTRWPQNQIWWAVVALACDVTAGPQLLALHGHPARRWEPKRLGAAPTAGDHDTARAAGTRLTPESSVPTIHSCPARGRAESPRETRPRPVSTTNTQPTKDPGSVAVTTWVPVRRCRAHCRCRYRDDR